MLSSIYLKTLRDLRGLILAWGLGLAAASALNVIFFPTFQNLPEMVSFLKTLPPVFKSLLGDIDAVMTVEGFLRVKIFYILPLLLSIVGVSQGARALSGEFEHKTGDMLLALPIARRRVVAEKFAAVVTAVTVVGCVILVGLIAACAAVGADVDRGYLAVAIFNSLPLTWLFVALAVYGSCALRHSRHAAMLAGGAVIASYVFETVRIISPELAGWRVVSPFAHHNAAVSFAGELSPEPSLAFAALALLLLLGAASAFGRRDLTT